MTTETDDGAKGPECSCDADFLRVMGRHGKLCPCERVGKQTPIGVSRYILCSVALDSHNKPNAISIEADAQTVCDHLSANPQLRAAVLTGLVNGGDTQARLVRLTDRVLAEPGVRNIEKVLDLEQQLRLAEFGLAAQLNELRGLYAAFHGSGHSPKNPREAAQAIGQMRDAESELAAERARVAELAKLVAAPFSERDYDGGKATRLALLDVIEAAESLAMIHRANRMAGLPTPALEAFDAALAKLEKGGPVDG